MIDKQQRKVYDSENDLEEVVFHKKWKTVQGCQNYVDDFTSKRWFRNRFGIVNITVTKERTNQIHALGSAIESPVKTISLPNWAKNEIILLHEMSHCLLPHRVKHGKEFCATYLQLIEYNLGKKARRILEIFFKLRKVAYK